MLINKDFWLERVRIAFMGNRSTKYLNQLKNYLRAENKNTNRTGATWFVIGWQGPLLLTWFNFNLSMDK